MNRTKTIMRSKPCSKANAEEAATDNIVDEGAWHEKARRRIGENAD